MRHRDIADDDRRFKVVDPSLVEQLSRFVARGRDIARKTRYRDELRLWCCHARAGSHDTPDKFEKGRALQPRRSTPAVDGERQRAPHPFIVKRRAIGIEYDKKIGKPGTFTGFHTV